MSAEPITCPYCNARVEWTASLKVGQRTTCARCGESFVLTQLPEPPTTPPAPTASPASGRRPKPVKANRWVAAGILGVMLVMAGTGLTFALLTVETRRQHDKALPRKSRRPWQTELPPPAEQAVAPSALPGLGYLPNTTGLIVALQVQELLASPTGQEFRSRSFRIANSDFQLDNLKELVGIGVEELDHLVLGVTVQDDEDAELTPPTQLIVRTSKPLDKRRIQVALKASRQREDRSADSGKRTIYSASLRGVPATLWFADDRTVILGLFGQFEKVPTTPHEGTSALRIELRNALDQRVPPGAVGWIVGHAQDWKKTWLPTLTAQFNEVPLLTRLGEIQTFSLGLMPTKPAKVLASFRCLDEARAVKIEQEELLPRVETALLKYSRSGPWLDVQWTVRNP